MDQIGKTKTRRGFCCICGVKDHYSLECSLKDHQRSLFCPECDSYGHLKSGCHNFTNLQKPIFSKQRRDSKREVAEAKRSESNESCANNSDSIRTRYRDSVCKEVAMAENVRIAGKKWSSMLSLKNIDSISR